MSNFPSYPGGAGSFAPQPPPSAPPSVLTAVKLMYVGAGLSLLSLIIGLASKGTIRHAVRRAQPTWDTSKVNTFVNSEYVGLIVVGIIGIGLWAWMASVNKRGRNWGRITGTVFFGFFTLGFLGNLAEHGSAILKVLSVVSWLVALATVILLWRRESGAYFKGPQYPDYPGGSPGYPGAPGYPSAPGYPGAPGGGSGGYPGGYPGAQA